MSLGINVGHYGWARMEEREGPGKCGVGVGHADHRATLGIGTGTDQHTASRRGEKQAGVAPVAQEGEVLGPRLFKAKHVNQPHGTVPIDSATEVVGQRSGGERPGGLSRHSERRSA